MNPIAAIIAVWFAKKIGVSAADVWEYFNWTDPQSGPVDGQIIITQEETEDEKKQGIGFK